MRKFFLGYYDTKDLALKKGDEVTIRKGVQYHQTYHGTKTAGRTYKVKVDHVLPGVSYFVGYWVDGKFYSMWNSTQDIKRVKELYGTDDVTQLWPLLSVQDSQVYISIEPPKVCWAGSGGYWCEADINDIPEAQEKENA